MTKSSGLPLSQRQCPLCGAGLLQHQCEKVEIFHRGVFGHINHIFSRCDHCHVDQLSGCESRHNKAQAIAFRQYIDDVLDGSPIQGAA